jgi:heterokaryon incompatibility protein (HET)
VQEPDNQSSYIQITRNLYDVILRLRLHDRPRILWADGACINQQDVAERTEQVQLMRQIYQSASEVLIWLGEATPESDEALRLVPSVAQIAREDAAAGITRNIVIPAQRPDCLPWASDPIWERFAEIMNREWFQRAWVVQELAVATKATMLCGNTRVSYDDMSKTIEFLMKSNTLLVQARFLELNRFDCMLDARKAFISDKDTPPLALLLRQRSKSSSEKIDKLFAFHGLFKPGSVGALATMPDYNLTCLEAYKRFASEILTSSRNLDILSVPRATETSEIGDLPSWVPDWSCSDLCTPLIQTQMSSEASIYPDHFASGHSLYDPVILESGSKLVLRGHIVDAIYVISAPLEKSEAEKEGDITKAILHQRQLTEFDLVAMTNVPGAPMLSYPLTDEHIVDVYWQTLFGGCMDAYKPMMRAAFFRNWNMHFLFIILQLLRLDQKWFISLCIGFWNLWRPLYWLWYVIYPTNWEKSLSYGTVSFVLKMSMMRTGYRRVFKTQQGLIGLAPRFAQSGDFVVICQGGKVPLVIRPKFNYEQGQSETGDWEFIGESYVHGAMDGKVWEVLEGTREAREFVLS